MKLLGYAVFKNDKMVKNKIFPTYEQAEMEAKSIHKWKEVLKCRFILPMVNEPFEADIRAILSEEVIDSNEYSIEPKSNEIPEEYPSVIAEEIAYNPKGEKDGK